MNNSKKFNIITLLSFFSKNIIEIFISVILYKLGIGINKILLYMLFNNIISIILIILIMIFRNKIKIKWLIVINYISFVLFSIYLFNMSNNIYSLLLLSFLSTLHNTLFWILRHLYIIKIYDIENMSKKLGNILIICEISIILSSYVGSTILNNYSYIILIILSSVILLISNIILFNINIKLEKIEKIDFSILKNNKQNLLLFTLEQFKIIGVILFPLYITIILNTSYKFIGIFNIFIGIASIISLLYFTKLISKKKKSYLAVISIIFFIIWILKINISIKFIIILIAFFEGIISKLYQIVINRFTYVLGKHYSYFNYIIVLELLFNFIKFIIMLIFMFFIKDLKLILYICACSFIVTSFVKFDDMHK